MENQLLSINKNLPEYEKWQRKKLADQIAQAIHEGKIDGLGVLQTIRAWEDVFKRIQESETFTLDLLSELDYHGGKSVRLNGHTLEQAEAGIKYDFSVCNDPIYKRLVMQLEVTKSQLKTREEYLKHLPKEGLAIVDLDSGEVSRVYPPNKTSKTIVKVSLK